MMKTFKYLLPLVAMVLLAPDHALAWGPVAHLDFATQLVFGLVSLSPAVTVLIKKFADDFLYGSLAADAIVGKNRAKAHDHCHSWPVARTLLEKAKKERSSREAFVLGYIAHLGADVVAHNHIVPQMMVEHYRKKGVGHMYWEARADQRILSLKPELFDTWKELSTKRFKDHDEFLQRELTPTLFPNRLSARIYEQSLNVQKLKTWRRFFERIERRSVLMFDNDTLMAWTKLAVESAKKAIENPGSTRLDTLDPTGKDSLARAVSRRRALRRKLRKARKDPTKERLLETAYKRALLETRQVDINMFEADS